jgi:serine/threonine protein kinase
VQQNGEIIAVKKLVQALPSLSSHKQFENEVNLLMKLKHPNIVRLVGYCYETQHLHTPHEKKFVFAENIETLLCLECLPNGSLDKHISGMILKYGIVLVSLIFIFMLDRNFHGLTIFPEKYVLVNENKNK